MPPRQGPFPENDHTGLADPVRRRRDLRRLRIGRVTSGTARATAVGNVGICNVKSPGMDVGGASILDPVRLKRDLDIPADWTPMARPCLGWPRETTLTPDLETEGRAHRAPALHIESHRCFA